MHNQIAALVSWSMTCAAQGQWPNRGFHGEGFDPKSVRGQYAGQLLAKGWRTQSLKHVVLPKDLSNRLRHTQSKKNGGKRNNIVSSKCGKRFFFAGWLIGPSDSITKRDNSATTSQDGLTANSYVIVAWPSGPLTKLTQLCYMWISTPTHHVG